MASFTLILIIPWRISLGVIVVPRPNWTSKTCYGAALARASSILRFLRKLLNIDVMTTQLLLVLGSKTKARVASFNDCSIIIIVLRTLTSFQSWLLPSNVLAPQTNVSILGKNRIVLIDLPAKVSTFRLDCCSCKILIAREVTLLTDTFKGAFYTPRSLSVKE